MTQGEFAFLVDFFDLLTSLGILAAFVVAFIRGDIVSSRVVEKVVSATVDELLERVKERSN